MGDKIIDLDRCVIEALELFDRTKLPKVDVKFKKPLVVGSGNAAVVGKILFGDREAVFADESNYLNKLKNIKGIDGCILISASGGKHAPVIAKKTKKFGIKTILFTNNEDALAKKYVDKIYVFLKNVEPYTYNISTYLGMILAFYGESIKNIRKGIDGLKKYDFSKYNSFFILVPDKFDSTREMFQTKFDELFGSMIQARVFTYEQAKHAKTVVSSDKELFIGLGVENKVFGKKRLNVELPRGIGFGGIVAIGYYLIGQIQKQNPQYFKENIDKYVKKISKVFDQDIKIIS